jgi:hypothetical protein
MSDFAAQASGKRSRIIVIRSDRVVAALMQTYGLALVEIDGGKDVHVGPTMLAFV